MKTKFTNTKPNTLWKFFFTFWVLTSLLLNSSIMNAQTPTFTSSGGYSGGQTTTTNIGTGCGTLPTLPFTDIGDVANSPLTITSSVPLTSITIFCASFGGGGSSGGDETHTFDVPGTTTEVVSFPSNCLPGKLVQSGNSISSVGVIAGSGSNGYYAPVTITSSVPFTSVVISTNFTSFGGGLIIPSVTANGVAAYTVAPCLITPTLSGSSVSNTCPANTANLTSITATNTSSGSTLTWHTGTPATSANEVATPSTVVAGTYYASFHDATNNCYSATSSAVTVTTTSCCANTAITQQPANLTLCKNNTGTMSVVATGTNLTYQWEFSFDGITSAGNAGEIGNTTSTITVNSGAATDIYFRSKVSNGTCILYSNWAHLIVVSLPNTPTPRATTISNICPAITADLTALQPAAVAGQSYEWHTVASNPTAANLVATPSAVGTSGSYYLYSKTTTGSCFSTGSTVVTVTIATCCSAGTTAPALSATTKSNTCPATTISLTTITSSNTPSGSTLEWHTGTPATSANKVATPGAVNAGTYYAVFYDATNNCYSNSTGTTGATSVTAVANTCTSALTISNPSAQSVTTNSPKSGSASTDLAPTGGTSPYVYTAVAGTNPGGATALPTGSNLTVNPTTGAYSYTVPTGTAPGTYYFGVQVCDASSPAQCQTATYTVNVAAPSCNAGTTAPVPR